MKTEPIIKANQPAIDQLIWALRQEFGLTQEFAHELGVTFMTVSRWERFDSRPSLLALKVIEYKVAEFGERGNELVQEYLMLTKSFGVEYEFLG
ncbi:helix-turn-helix domain-containing protein [Spirulina sp. CS-785/01]|uniref:helix-turn-helix domain-containing protein n=1 Tax=Spirulina sp. CS-785/01 TaxID=3021716 RepID=UPI00232FD545|nr:helix-turn-helix domain-containing protein [Spirulina sp. CS-785/01]MDB9314169.1 helix-turn-helix domain-containing protein [Spirulina sp. CS-785/01]